MEHGQVITSSDADCCPPFKEAVTVTADSPIGDSASARLVNSIVEDPAGTFTEDGTAKTQLLAESDTVIPPLVAGDDNVIMQAAVDPADRMAGLQLTPVTSVGATRVKLAVCEAPFKLAVTAALCVLVSVPAVAVKVAVVAPGVTVTDAGTLKAALLLATATTLPPAGAAWLNVIVQVVEELAFTLAGLQDRPVTTMGATKVKLAVCVVPFKLALTVALCVVIGVPPAARKVAVIPPAGTVTDTGTVNHELLLARATALPPVGAA